MRDWRLYNLLLFAAATTRALFFGFPVSWPDPLLSSLAAEDLKSRHSRGSSQTQIQDWLLGAVGGRADPGVGCTLWPKLQRQLQTGESATGPGKGVAYSLKRLGTVCCMEFNAEQVP